MMGHKKLHYMLEQFVETIVRIKNLEKIYGREPISRKLTNNFIMRCKQNQPSNLGSSETIREVTQEIQFSAQSMIAIPTYFNDYERFGKPTHLKKLNIPFLEWFIGFTEGDGHFATNKCAFIISQKDPKLLFKIKKNLGFGSVFKTTQPEIWRYSVTGQLNCLRLYYLFNGNLSLAKSKNRFRLWSKQLKSKIPLKKTSFPITLNNGWFSGFIEAEGGFYGRVRKNNRTKMGFQFQKKFYITQKGESESLKRILTILESNANIYTFNQFEESYNRIDISSFHSHEILLKYLQKFPNLGKKNISVGLWRKMHGRQSRQEHLTITGLTKLRQLCENLNRHHKRIELSELKR